MSQSINYELTWKIRRSFKLLASFADSYLEPYGIVAGERAVMEFIQGGGPKSVPDIARSFHVSRQNIQIRVNGLVKKGLLERHDNPAHKRSPLIALSNMGHDIFQTIREEEQHRIGRLFDGISNEAVAQASGVLSRLIDRLDDSLGTLIPDNKET